uniref:Uncharacterized protein n=1 Tax=Lutzomyia longipalpis TaxID=7200 RepID=A0A1B0GJU6_LUTLO
MKENPFFSWMKSLNFFPEKNWIYYSNHLIIYISCICSLYKCNNHV